MSEEREQQIHWSRSCRTFTVVLGGIALLSSWCFGLWQESVLAGCWLLSAYWFLYFLMAFLVTLAMDAWGEGVHDE